MNASNNLLNPPTCPICLKPMVLHVWDRPGGPPGNGWGCTACKPGIAGVDQPISEKREKVAAELMAKWTQELADEQALRDAVVKWALLADEASPFTADLDRCEAARAEAIEALRTHRTKLEPARCEPPEWAKGEIWHWLKREDSGATWPWHWFSGSLDWKTVDDGVISPEELSAAGWSWHSVAKPSREDCCNEPYAIVALREIRTILGNSDLSVVEQVRQLVAKPETTALVEPITDRVLDQWASTCRACEELTPNQTAEIARDLINFLQLRGYFKPQAEKVEASDEAIDAFLLADHWTGWGTKLRDTVKKALTKFTPPKAGTLGRYEYLNIALRSGMKRCTSPGKTDWFELTVPAMDFIREYARAIEAKVRGT